MTAVPIRVARDRVDVRRWSSWLVLVGGAIALQLVFSTVATFPAKLDTTLSNPIDDAGAWMRSNRRTHPLFTGFFTPISRFIDSIITGIADFLLWAPWFAVIAIAVALPVSKKMWTETAVITASFVYIGLFDLWEPSMETTALMSASVMLAVVVGVPLGVWAALRPRVEHTIRPVLDAMQTIPAFVYFLPLFMLLGIGDVPAAVTTIVYALPPVVRLTTLGIKQVPSDAVEASEMFGASRRQTMLKVQLPMAIRTIVTGMSQTVMMALGIVVLATLIGAGGLGSPILQSLNQRRVGRGFAAGFAIVAIALVLDRISRSVAERDPLRRLSRTSDADDRGRNRRCGRRRSVGRLDIVSGRVGLDAVRHDRRRGRLGQGQPQVADPLDQRLRRDQALPAATRSPDRHARLAGSGVRHGMGLLESARAVARCVRSRRPLHDRIDRSVGRLDRHAGAGADLHCPRARWSRSPSVSGPGATVASRSCSVRSWMPSRRCRRSCTSFPPWSSSPSVSCRASSPPSCTRWCQACGSRHSASRRCPRRASRRRARSVPRRARPCSACGSRWPPRRSWPASIRSS